MWEENWKMLNNFFIYLIKYYVTNTCVELEVNLHAFLVTAE